MKKLLVSFAAAMVLLTSCSTIKTVSDNGNQLRFTEAHNYFHIGKTTVPIMKKITSRTVLEKEFGEAATMGKDGEPTKIDFRRKFAIAFILPETNRKTDLSPLSLTVKGKNRLILKYKLKQGEELPFSTQPFFLIVVDRKYVDYAIEK